MPESNIQTNNPLDPADEPEPGPEPLCIDVAVNHSILVSEDRVREIVRQILQDYDWRTGEISIAVVDDETIQKINQQFLDHDYETDVLSFVLDCDEQQRLLIGEVVISADTAISIGTEEHIDPRDELLLYLIHGTLHLVGFDDKDDCQRVEMRRAEAHYTTMFSVNYSPPGDPEIDGESA